MAVFDSFTSKRSRPSHGENVTHVLDTHGQVSRNGIKTFSTGSSSNSSAPLTRRIEQRAASMLDSTSNNIQKILSDPNSKIRVINQSQSVSELRVVEDIMEGVRSSPRKHAELAKELGLSSSVPERELVQALVHQVDKVFENSPRIASAKARYDKLSTQLEQRGILHVLTAGNTGDYLQELDQQGIRYDKDFSESVLFNQHKVVVAASTGGANEQIADFSTPSRHVSVAIDGTSIRLLDGRTSNGTSYSAPQVAALIDDLWRSNPNLTTSQVRNILKQASRDTAASNNLEGSGILDPQQARRLARP